MMQIALIGDEDTINGFMLAGVKHSIKYREDKLEEDLKKFSEAKVLVFTEKVGEQLRKTGLIDKIENTYLEIPDKTGSSGQAMQKISNLFESAIGIALKENE